MAKDNNEVEIVEEFKEILKPKIFWPIWNTILCSAPPVYLILSYFIFQDIKNPTFTVILTVIALIWNSINWYWYVKERIDFKKNWPDILVELETIDNYEITPKKYTDTIFDKLKIIALASLLALMIFVVITLLTKLSLFKYLVIISLLILLLSGLGIGIYGIVIFFSFLKEVKNAGRLKIVLIKFLLIYTVSFVIQIIVKFIMHKYLDWFGCLLNSLPATILITMYTEFSHIFKEIKKSLKEKYSDETVSGENDNISD